MSQNLLLTGISLVSLGVIATSSHVVALLNPQVFAISIFAGGILGLLGTFFMKEISSLAPEKVTLTAGLVWAAALSSIAVSHFFFNPISQWGFIQNQVVSLSGVSLGFALSMVSGFVGLRAISAKA